MLIELKPLKLSPKEVKQKANAKYYQKNRARILAKNKKKKNVLYRYLPETPIENRAPQEWVTIESDMKVKDHHGGLLLRLFHQAIPPSLLATLASSLSELMEKFPPHAGVNGNRGDKSVYHFGTWRSSSVQPYLIADTRNEHSQRWISTNYPLFQKVEQIFKETFPQLHQQYKRIADEQITTVIACWCSLAVNIDFPATVHTDTKDYRHGYCWVLPFGTWTEGGDLRCEKINVEVKLRPGDLVCFQSSKIPHWVTNYNNVRNSIVFFTHHSMFYPVEEE
jgi:hypothetical protein